MFIDNNNFPIILSQKVLDKAKELEISPEDIEEEFVRGSGAGGQKVNKTSSTVFLKHLPTNIFVKVQKHREREKNRISAYKLLISKIEDLKKGKESERAKKIFKIKKQKQRRSKKAKEKVLKAKHERSAIKEIRKNFNI